MYIWQVPQYSADPISVWVSPAEDLVSPADSFRGRAHARQLILRGDFAGAFHAVEPLIDDPEETEWILPLENAAKYFAGNLPFEPGLPPYLHRLADPDNPRCLLAAMRTEAALCMGLARVSEAVAWTCAFFDAALLDFMERLPDVVDFDDFARMISFAKEPPSLLTKPGPFGRDGSGCLDRRGADPGTYAYRYSTLGGEIVKRWLNVINVGPLKNLNRSLAKKDADGLQPRDYRNITMHSMVPQELMKRLVDGFTSANLWRVSSDDGLSAEDLVAHWAIGVTASEDPLSPGDHFLARDPIKGVLQELGFSDPVKLYRDLVDGLIQEMTNYEIR